MGIQAMMEGAVGALAVTGGFWALGKYGPKFVVSKFREGFDAVKDSDWVRNPAKPKRARALLALAELIEDEIPEAGQGQEVYDGLGADIAEHSRIGPFQVGSAAQWSKVLQQFGDAFDTELDADIKALAAPPAAAANKPA